MAFCAHQQARADKSLLSSLMLCRIIVWDTDTYKGVRESSVFRAALD